MTVALSRARLGLYILGRRDVFDACFELRAAFDRLLRRPTALQVVPGELFPAARGVDDQNVAATEMTGIEHLGQYVFEMTQAKVKQLEAGGLALPAPEAKAHTDVDGSVEAAEDRDAEVEGQEGGDLAMN